MDKTTYKIRMRPARWGWFAWVESTTVSENVREGDIAPLGSTYDWGNLWGPTEGLAYRRAARKRRRLKARDVRLNDVRTVE